MEIKHTETKKMLNETSKIIIEDNNSTMDNEFTRSTQNINLAQNTWMKNGNLFYSPTQLSNSYSILFFCYFFNKHLLFFSFFIAFYI